jgi:hypothetical protein
MRFRTNAKAVREGYYYIISAGYCALQRLLSSENPIAYSAGTYGWNFDLYQIDDFPGVAIVTGYRPVKEIHAKRDYKVNEKYEILAEAIKYDNNRRDNLRKLIKAYINEMIIVN